MVNPALLGAPITALASATRVRKLANLGALTYGNLAALPTVVQGPQTGGVGVLTGGVLLRGSAIPANLTGLVRYAQAGSTGASISSTPLMSVIWGFGSESWAISGPATYSDASLYYGSTSRGGPTTISFTTNSLVVGISGGSGGSASYVWGVCDEGSGFCEMTPLPPAPTTNAQGGDLYFIFQTAVQRTFILQTGGFGCLILQAAANISPINLRRTQITGATAGDSIANTTPNLRGIKSMVSNVLLEIGCYCNVDQSVGGSGYGQPNSGSGLTSLSGNLGVYTNGAALNANPIRTNAIIAAQPDIILIPNGVNEAIPTGGDGWDTASAMLAVWTRLRAGCPSSVLVAVMPFTGNDGGSNDGGVGSKYPALRAQITATMEQITGPWIVIDTYTAGWSGKREDGSTFSGASGTGPWVTGHWGGSRTSTYSQSGVGNASSYIYDGIHPAPYVIGTVASTTTLGTTLPLVDASQFPPPLAPATSVTMCIMPASNSVIDYAGGITCAYTGRGGVDTFTLTGVSGYSGSIPAGSRVYLPNLMTGVDYYTSRISIALKAAMALL